ncbi:DUF4255 domain-containing protein [Dyella choica]|uniref:DUF4255 domain-containing protein n=1 Tax=Dyella choica TaxID=1927959 RepID=A0A3S0SC68_9GAMM|nr:DUF4255 domain-containing protein [Dyella choica]RUL78934.1 DUF4255 domain-containing protein [Dyella choica]
MSNALAIAAATCTLRNLLQAQIPLLDSDLSDISVTLQPPDMARKGVSSSQLNLFLYQVVYNAAWRNMDMPGRVRAGESGQPPLALNLHYLITAWGRGETDPDAVSHRVLSAAMSFLHDRPLLDRSDIRSALLNNDLADQIERVRLTPLPQSVEEISKLWTAFQTNYRVSSAYEATVVLIDSHAPTRANLPVLTRGPQDRGVATTTSVAPVLSGMRFPHSQAGVRLGDDIVLAGSQLTATNAIARFTSLRLDAPVDVTPTAGDTQGTLNVHLAGSAEDANAASRWAPGIYTLSLLLQPPGSPALLSNELPLSLAPIISVSPLSAAAGTLLHLTCMPRIRDGQRVGLLFGSQWLLPQSISNPVDPHLPTALTFKVPGVPADTYTIRLRVDGADSIPVDFSGAVPKFDPNQQVVVP